MYYIFSGNTGGPVALIGYAQGAEGYAKQEAKRLMGYYVHENHLNDKQAKQVRQMHALSVLRSADPDSPCLCVACQRSRQ
jgi:hypothetical protein